MDCKMVVGGVGLDVSAGLVPGTNATYRWGNLFMLSVQLWNTISLQNGIKYFSQAGLELIDTVDGSSIDDPVNVLVAKKVAYFQQCRYLW